MRQLQIPILPNEQETCLVKCFADSKYKKAVVFTYPPTGEPWFRFADGGEMHCQYVCDWKYI